jgi:hypothetical protein
MLHIEDDLTGHRDEQVTGLEASTTCRAVQLNLQ